MTTRPDSDKTRASNNFEKRLPRAPVGPTVSICPFFNRRNPRRHRSPTAPPTSLDNGFQQVQAPKISNTSRLTGPLTRSRTVLVN
jgi:hypothetical protein